jgi:hypothetical protein
MDGDLGRANLNLERHFIHPLTAGQPSAASTRVKRFATNIPTAQRDVGSLMGLVTARFRTSSRTMPIQCKPPQISARTFASFSPIPPGEDDQVDAIERGDLLGYRIAEYANGKPCIGI